MLFNKKNSRAIAEAAEQAQVHGRSLWQDAWRRFSNNKAAPCRVIVRAGLLLAGSGVSRVRSCRCRRTDAGR